MEAIRKYFDNEIRRRCLSVSAIEREAGIPQKTLAHFLKGRRGLSKNHVEKLKKVLGEMGF